MVTGRLHAALAARDRVLPSAAGADATTRLHLLALRLRDVLLVVLTAVVLLVPGADRRNLAVAAALVLVVLPYNAMLRVRLQRTGRVPACIAWADQVLAASFAAIWPELAGPAMIAAMLDVAVAAVMLDRRAALRGAAAGGLLFTAATAWTAPTLGVDAGQVMAVSAYAVSAVTTAYVVGTVGGRERAVQQQLTELLDSLEVVVYEMDAETLEVRYVSPYLRTITGRPTDEYLGDPTPFLAMVHRRDSAKLVDLVGAVRDGRRSYDLEYRVYDGEGQVHWVRNMASVVQGPDGRSLIRGSIADITRQKQAEDALARQARTDPLTGLANRAQLLTELASWSGQPRLLVFLDLDSFKRINDSLGHSAGDALLVHTADRLTAAVRPEDHVARLGGDEFVVLLTLTDEAAAEQVAARVQQAFDLPFDLAGRAVRVTASAGAVVVAGGQAGDAEDLLEQADAAMYTAKRTGPGRTAFAGATTRAAALQRLDVESEIATALEQQQFALVYQPIVRSTDRVVLAHEALLRWLHPTRGTVSPAEFIPVAEQSAQIVPIGRWVLREACLQARRWRDAGGPASTMSVNLSALQLSDLDLVDDVREALAEAGLDAHELCLEVTETALIAHPERALASMRALRALGVRIALDDFGTGFSSLSHLHRYPVDTVKIDRSFVADVGRDEGGHGIVTAILHLAAHMKLTVVAEGVETAEQADVLAELGCDLLQGYALGAPAAAVDLPAPRTNVDERIRR